jgi:chromosome partitioning protein
LHGILPEAEVDEEMTIAPLCNGTSDDITPAIRSTYWDGIDLVAAAPFCVRGRVRPARAPNE